jgi:hypothetical protein
MTPEIMASITTFSTGTCSISSARRRVRFVVNRILPGGGRAPLAGIGEGAHA